MVGEEERSVQYLVTFQDTFSGVGGKADYKVPAGLRLIHFEEMTPEKKGGGLLFIFHR